MALWADFELECTEYLNDRFGSYATFTHQGGADSTVADIFVETNSGKQFYIDAKHSPAQCGQFVLFPHIESLSFKYSTKNINNINPYSQAIMLHMNKDFDAFREAGTKGKEIIMPNSSQIFSEWIIQTYKEKGAEFFITNNFKILPIDNFEDYFDVTAKYRIKRSGSGDVGAGRISVILNYITDNFTITDSRIQGSKLFVKSDDNLHNKRFIYGEFEYMFSQRGNIYEIRKLSNTYNANVIFSIKLKNHTSGLSDSEFIQALL